MRKYGYGSNLSLQSKKTERRFEHMHSLRRICFSFLRNCRRPLSVEVDPHKTFQTNPCTCMDKHLK